MRQGAADLDHAVDAFAGVRLVPQFGDPLFGQAPEEECYQLVGVGRPVLEVVVEGPRGDAEPAAYLGQLQPPVAQVRENVEPDLEVRVP